MEWPQRRHEEWIRSDLRLFKLEIPRSRRPKRDDRTSREAQLLSEGVELGGRDVDGRQPLPSGVPRRSLWPPKVSCSAAWSGWPASIRNWSASISSRPSTSTTTALRHCMRRSGREASSCMCPAGSWSTSRCTWHVARRGGADLAHTLIVLEEGAEATVLHEANSVDARCQRAVAWQRRDHPEAGFTFAVCQFAGTGTQDLPVRPPTRHRRSRRDDCSGRLAAMGNGFAKVNQSVALVGPGADSQVNGVLFTEGRQHIAYHTLQHHVAPNCHSDFLYKSAQQDQSRTVWRGMIKVDKIAQKTDGYQRNDNLVLSSRARADSIPGLEIEADDVRCTHGSTTAQSRRGTNLLCPVPWIYPQRSSPDDRDRLLPADL